MMYPLCLFTIIAASLPFPYVGVCIFGCLTINTMCVSGWRVSWDEICSKAQNVHLKKNSRAHSRSLLGNEWIQSPDTIRPISYIIFSLSFTIHQLSLRLIYEAYFIFREFSDDRKLISSALVLLLTVAQSRSGQSWNCFNILSVSACCWHKTLYYNSTVEGLTNKEKKIKLTLNVLCL